jgi:hypothetical protein
MVIAAFVALAGVGCEGDGSDGTCVSYTEADHPAAVSEVAWAAVPPGLHVAVGSLDEHYFRSAVPDLPRTLLWRGAAWRGERVSAQIVTWAADSLPRMEVVFSDFVAESGEVLPADMARARFVRYVLTDEYAGGCGYRKPEDFAVHLYPDALDGAACFDKPSNSTRPLWITIEVPRDASPGVYTSTMEVRARRRGPVTVHLELEVLSRTLPPPSEWEFHLDLWQNPYAVPRIEGVELWSEAHWEALVPLMKLLADAGQKVITTTITEAPWDGQTFDPFGSMVEWRVNGEGSWEFDYTVFDRWVEFMMSLGVDEQINAYSLIPWSSQLTYFDESAGEKVVEEVTPGSDRYVELWTPFLIDFRAHLEEKGWYTITNIAMDESRSEDFGRMLDMMNQLAPGIGIALADNSLAFRRFPDRIQDLSVSYSDAVDQVDLEERRSRGFPSTYYVCCSDPFPNTFTFSPPAEAAFIGWYATAAGFDGVLRWSYNSWVEDPLRDSRFRTWPAGDTYIVYPGAMSSIRFERLVEGIQDAEKIRLLREELAASGTDEAREKLESLEAMLRVFDVKEKPEGTDELLNRGKAFLLELSRG